MDKIRSKFNFLHKLRNKQKGYKKLKQTTSYASLVPDEDGIYKKDGVYYSQPSLSYSNPVYNQQGQGRKRRKRRKAKRKHVHRKQFKIKKRKKINNSMRRRKQKRHN